MAIGEVGGGRGSPELGLPQPRAVWEEALHGLRSHRESHCSPRLHSCVCACHGPGLESLALVSHHPLCTGQRWAKPVSAIQ